MPALGTRQAVGGDDARCREAEVAAETAPQQVADLRDLGGGLACTQADHGDHRHALGRRRGDAPVAGGAQSLGDLAEHEAGRRRVGGEHARRTPHGDLDQGGVTPGPHRGRARLPGEQRQLAEHLRRARARAPRCRRRAPRADRVRTTNAEPGGSPCLISTVTGRQPDEPRGALEAVPSVLRERGEQRQVGEVDGVGASRAGRRTAQSAGGSGGSTTGGRSSATVLVLGDRRDAARGAAPAARRRRRPRSRAPSPRGASRRPWPGWGRRGSTTRMAMPSTPPSWRALDTTADAVA